MENFHDTIVKSEIADHTSNSPKKLHFVWNSQCFTIREDILHFPPLKRTIRKSSKLSSKQSDFIEKNKFADSGKDEKPFSQNNTITAKASKDKRSYANSPVVGPKSVTQKDEQMFVRFQFKERAIAPRKRRRRSKLIGTARKLVCQFCQKHFANEQYLKYVHIPRWCRLSPPKSCDTENDKYECLVCHVTHGSLLTGRLQQADHTHVITTLRCGHFM